jgi:cell division septation protein DedD
MRSLGMLALVALCAVGWMTGCTSDEPPPPAPEPEVVRKTIETPPNPAGAASKSEEGVPAPVPEPEETGVSVEEAAAGEPMEDREESGVTGPETATASTGRPAEARVAAEAEPDTEEGSYLVQPGDSLAVVAGREDVFGDPLKWPVLFQLNREKLSGMTLDERLPERALPEGIRIRYRLGPEERGRTERRTEQTWVVNVISSPTADRIDGPAARLLERGYPVYISRAVVKGQKWMRLRVGFYESRDAAVKAGGRLQEILDQEDSWPVRIGPEETAEFADLLMKIGASESESEKRQDHT